MQVGGPGQAVMALRQDDGSVVRRSGSFLVSEAPPGLITFDGEQHVVVFAGQAVLGLDPDSGEILWAHPHDAGNDFNFQIPLWSDEDDVLFLSSGYIGGSRAVKLRRDGDVTRVEELWYDPQLRFTFLNPIRLGDFVYGTSGQGATAIMTATHVATGETAWRERGFSRASLLHADGKTLIMEEDGDLSLVVLTPGGMTRLASMPLFDTRSWTAPTLVGATLYARDREVDEPVLRRALRRGGRHGDGEAAAVVAQRHHLVHPHVARVPSATSRSPSQREAARMVVSRPTGIVPSCPGVVVPRLEAVGFGADDERVVGGVGDEEPVGGGSAPPAAEGRRRDVAGLAVERPEAGEVRSLAVGRRTGQHEQQGEHETQAEHGTILYPNRRSPGRDVDGICVTRRPATARERSLPPCRPVSTACRACAGSGRRRA